VQLEDFDLIGAELLERLSRLLRAIRPRIVLAGRGIQALVAITHVAGPLMPTDYTLVP